MKPIARFAIRPNEQTSHHLILGQTQGRSPFLKEGFVYEIQEWDGELLIKEVGESCVKADRFNHAAGASWGNEINHIAYAGTHILTDEDLERYHDRQEGG